jgi:hypothetical protein
MAATPLRIAVPSVFALMAFVPLCAFAGDAQPIRLNTIGILPEQEKRASIALPCSQFSVVCLPDGTAAFSGKAADP